MSAFNNHTYMICHRYILVAFPNISLYHKPMKKSTFFPKSPWSCIVDYRNNYTDPKRGRMTAKDYAQAKIYGERAKEKYLAKKRKSND